MNIRDKIEEIVKYRVEAEYRKHKNIDWQMILTQKLTSSIQTLIDKERKKARVGVAEEILDAGTKENVSAKKYRDMIISADQIIKENKESTDER